MFSAFLSVLKTLGVEICPKSISPVSSAVAIASSFL